MSAKKTRPDSENFINRELSWLGFARRVLALVDDPGLPLLERVKFAGIMGMLHDEFFMKRMSGLKRQISRGKQKLSLDGRLPSEEFDACREELLDQKNQLARIVGEDLRAALAREGLPILDYEALDEKQRRYLRKYFLDSVQPILTPLAVDAEHPFPFISNLGLNLAILLDKPHVERQRFVRVKVPGNRPRWVPLPDGGGFVPLEQVIGAHLDLMFPQASPKGVHLFRVTRGAEGDRPSSALEEDTEVVRPGSLVSQVSSELKARRFAGVVRLQVQPTMPRKLVRWLARQLRIGEADIYETNSFLGLKSLLDLETAAYGSLRYPPHQPVTHPRLKNLPKDEPGAIFEAIAEGDLLLHHPYHDFDTSVLRFLESAAVDPKVLAIKLTIYRTSSESPIIRALVEAVRRGKQVAVLVEITARFDEAPNIAWSELLENEGAHVAYGVERLKTHVKLALVVREEKQGIRRYVHFGTGNYHPGTARLYEDVGILTCDRAVCEDAAKVFNALTGGMPYEDYRRMLVAPVSMRNRFVALIRREAEHARQGKASGIRAKMNQLQDPTVIRELYAASQAGVPISLNVRGLCCLRPGVPGLSETIVVFGLVGRFLEHSRIYRFENAGDPEYFIGSADWMKRNLDNRVETIVPVLDAEVGRELDEILAVYEADNCSAWDCGPDAAYRLRRPAAGEKRRAAQETLAGRAREGVRRSKESEATPPKARAAEGAG